MKLRRSFSLTVGLAALLIANSSIGFDFGKLGDLDKLKPNKDIQTAINLSQTAVKANADFSEEEKYYLGRSVGAHLLAKRKLQTREEMQRYVSSIGQVLALASDKPDTFKGYHFIVLDDKRVNAYAVPGGFIFVTTGLVGMAANEDELAGVLAHEIAHVVLEHPTEAIKQSYRDQLKKDLMNVAADKISEKQKDELTKQLVAGLNELSTELIDHAAKGYSRDKEGEADQLAVNIMVGAGYSPQALAAVLAKLDPIGSGESGTHGNPKERAGHVHEAVKKDAEAVDIGVSPKRTNRFRKQVKS